MKRTFVEMASFAKRVDKEDADVLRHIQEELLKNPSAGRVIQGAGGLRKLRIADSARGKGKRGGIRVIYLDLAVVGKTYLLSLYDKDEKGDISPDEKRVLRVCAEALKREAK